MVAKRLQDFLHLEPLELEIVAGGIPQEDTVFIEDLTLEKEPVAFFEQRVRELQPDIIGFTSYSNQSAIVKDLARKAKELVPGVLTVAGGIHATIIPADYAGSVFDLVVRGEGGSTFARLIERFKQGTPLAAGDSVLDVQAPDFRETSVRKAAALPRGARDPPAAARPGETQSVFLGLDLAGQGQQPAGNHVSRASRPSAPPRDAPSIAPSAWSII